MWSRRRPRQVSQVLWSRVVVSWRARNGKNSSRPCYFTGTWYEGAVLPHGRLGGVQHGGEEDRGLG